MNTEKIEKLKKTLSSTKLPADLKPKIEAEIKRLEDLDAKESEAKEEVKPVAKKTTTRKPRATKTVAKKTSTRKPSQTSKPKRTPMSLAKEIRKEGESWSDARARASKMMKEKTHTATKDVESELDKLTKLVRGKKELKGQIGRTNLLIDAKRKAKPMGRRISKDGNVYYENRANRTDKGTFGKYHLAEGGYLTDPNFGNFQTGVFADGGGVEDVSKSLSVSKLYDQDGNLMGYTIKDKYNVKGKYTLSNTKEKAEEILQYLIDNPSRLAYYRKNEYADGGFMDGVYAKGGGVRTINGREYSYGRNWTNDHNLTNKGEEHEVNYTRKKRFELGGTVVTDLAGHTGGSLGGDPTMLDGMSGTSYTGLVGETGAMSSGEMFENGGGVENKYYVGKFQTVRDWQTVVKPNGVRIEKDVDGYPVFKNNKVIYVYKTKKQALDKVETLNKRYNYELGGGLPSGVNQSYMITEAFGNPAQHFAKGGGIRRVGGREYPLGRNWTNDHEHTNKGEEHEVNYTRKGKFLGIFKDGGGIPNNYEGKTPEQVWNMWTPDQREHFLADHYDVMDGKDLDAKNKSFKSLNFLTQTQLELHIKQGQYAKGGGVRRVGNREYSLGRNWTNDHEHVNKAEEHETKYTRKKSFAGGGAIGETPKIYVADLEAYNNGRLSGVWLDLADYNDADELMEAIQDFLNTTGGEEYAIHDAEYIPSSMYSEYMGQRDFEELYEMIDLAKDNNLPLSVVQEVVSQYDASAVEEFQGKYDDAEDFAQQLVDDIGIESFTDFQYYLDISDTDRRLLSQDMADSYVDDIRDEDGGNRLIEEAGLDLDEYEEADSDRQEEMLDEAREIVYDEYYNNWYEGLSDPYYFLVEEQGMYSPDDFANANFVRVDYEKLGDALEQDYTFIYDDGELYVFNIR